jgi:hypothetical protein
VSELTVTALGVRQVPAIGFQHLDDLPDLHTVKVHQRAQSVCRQSLCCAVGLRL